MEYNKKECVNIYSREVLKGYGLIKIILLKEKGIIEKEKLVFLI